MKTLPLDQIEGTKSKSKSFRKSVQSEEPKFKVVDSDMSQDQEENPSKDDEEPKEKVASKCDWFTKPTQPQEPTDPDWNVDKTLQQGQNQSWLMTLASSVEKLSKMFDELMSTPIDFSTFIMNGLKINNLTQETLLDSGSYVLERLTFQLFEVRCAHDREKPRIFKEGDFLRLRINEIEDMLILVVQNWLTNFSGDDVSDFAIALRILILRNKTIYNSYSDPHGIIYVDQYKRKRLMRTDELHKFNDGTLNDVRSALHEIAAGIRMEYPPMRKWSNLDKKKARVMVQDIDKQLYQRRLMWNLEKFVGGREYENDLRLLERTI
ncbi:hypothetical protein Tco_1375405 [Tanacetum coccineum]